MEITAPPSEDSSTKLATRLRCGAALIYVDTFFTNTQERRRHATLFFYYSDICARVADLGHGPGKPAPAAGETRRSACPTCRTGRPCSSCPYSSCAKVGCPRTRCPRAGCSWSSCARARWANSRWRPVPFPRPSLCVASGPFSTPLGLSARLRLSPVGRGRDSTTAVLVESDLLLYRLGRDGIAAARSGLPICAIWV
jgi:hypothetical protein